MTHPSAKGRDAEDCHHDSLPQGSLTWPEGRAGSFRVKPEAEFGGGAGVSAGVRGFPGCFSWGPPVLAPPGHPRGSGSPPPRFPATASSSLFLSLCQSLPGHAVARLSVFLKDRCDHVVLLLTAPHCLLLCSRPRGADPARARWTPTPRACNPFPVGPTNTRGRCLSCSVHPEITPGSQPLPRPRSLPRNTSRLLLFWHRSRTATVFGNGRHHSIYSILILVAAFPLTKYSISRS